MRADDPGVVPSGVPLACVAALARIAALACVAALAGAGLGCRAPEPPPTTELMGEAMGTGWRAKVVQTAGCPASVEILAREVQAALDAVDTRMSTWKPDSELSRLNSARSTEPRAISPELFAVLSEAMEVSRLSGGAFDVTVAPLVDAWGFGPAGRETQPLPPAALEELRRRVGWRLLELDPAGPTVRKQRPDIVVDLSAIAKGYAVDRAAAALLDAGCPRFMVEVGGEVRTGGRAASDRPWRIGVESPTPGARRLESVVPLVDRAMATSGDYRNYHEVEGRRWSHVIDPRTGRPIEHPVASVTVVAGSCMRADALATALLVLGPEGFAMAEEHEIAALFLQRSGSGFEARPSTAFRPLLTQVD